MALATQTGSLWNNLLISVTSLHSHREVLGSLSLKQAPDPLGFVCVCLYFFQPCHVACGILVPQPGIDLGQGLQWKQSLNDCQTSPGPFGFKVLGIPMGIS